MECPTCGHPTPVRKNLTPGEDDTRECPECGESLDKSKGRDNLIQK